MHGFLWCFYNNQHFCGITSSLIAKKARVEVLLLLTIYSRITQYNVTGYLNMTHYLCITLHVVMRNYFRGTSKVYMNT